MDDNNSFLSHRREDAITRIEYYLSITANFSRLDSSLYDGLNAWKIEYKNSFSTWEIHIVFPKYYPDMLPKIKVTDTTNLFLVNPHIDEDGYLCIVPNTASYDGDNIISIFEYLIKSAKNILDGTEKTDFQDEFDAYWNRNLSPYQKFCLLLSSPENLEKKCRTFVGEKLICISSNKDKLSSWLNNFSNLETKDFKERECFVLKIDKPLLPEQYPNSIYDVLGLAKRFDNAIYTDLIKFISNSSDYCFILLTQNNLNKYSLGGILLSGLFLSNKQKYSNGFRQGHVPLNILIDRACHELKTTLINRCKINRADNNWIHSRGGDGNILEKKKIILLGCGSLGSYLVHYLAKTGVGSIVIVDKDEMEFSNIGRHLLGGDSFGESKSIELEKRINREMPHLKVKGIASDWREAYEKNDNLFRTADLIISTIADWRAEKPLNLLARATNFPPVAYAWLEPFAVAGHCFFSIPKSGCIECQMDKKGIFNERITSFENNTLKREIGACTYYQEYGPSALMPIISMVISEINKYLSNPFTESKLSTWISDEDHLSKVDAKITAEWKNKINISGYSRIYYDIIMPDKECKACSKT